MTPQQLIQLQELYAWMQEKKHQQISYPLDEASRNSLGTSTLIGPGSTTATHTITIPAGGGSATVPINPLGTIVVEFRNVQYEIPYIALP